MRARIYQASDDRWVVLIAFRREAPDGGEPTIEVIYHLHWPEDFNVAGDPFVLVPLSCTREDTREPVKLTPDETTMTMDAAVAAAGRYHQEISEP